MWKKNMFNYRWINYDQNWRQSMNCHRGIFKFYLKVIGFYIETSTFSQGKKTTGYTNIQFSHILPVFSRSLWMIVQLNILCQALRQNNKKIKKKIKLTYFNKNKITQFYLCVVFSYKNRQSRKLKPTCNKRDADGDPRHFSNAI